MLGLTPSELGIVLFIFLLVVGAAKLPVWGEKLGGYLHRRSEAAKHDPKTDGKPPPATGPAGRS